MNDADFAYVYHGYHAFGDNMLLEVQVLVKVSSEIFNSVTSLDGFTVDINFVECAFLSCCLLPKYMNSVLDLLSLSLTSSIHSFILSIASSMITMVSYSVFPGLNAFLI